MLKGGMYLSAAFGDSVEADMDVLEPKRLREDGSLNQEGGGGGC